MQKKKKQKIIKNRYEWKYRQLAYCLLDIISLLASFIAVTFFLGIRETGYFKVVFCTWIFCASFVIIFSQLFGTNRNLWRYAGAKEYITLINSYVAGYLLWFILDKTLFRQNISELLALLAVIIALLMSLYIRAAYRLYKNHENNLVNKNTRYLAIIGAGNAGMALQESITRNIKSPYTVWGFFDDDTRKIGRSINGIRVRGSIKELPDIIKSSPVHELVLAIPSLSIERRQQIIEMCGKLQCRLRIMPDTIMVMENSSSIMERSIRSVRIEDLLGRTSVHFEDDKLTPFIKGKTIIVTGGGGSIGSELSRQIVASGVEHLIIFDINENDSYILYRELKPILPEKCKISIEIGSMVNRERVNDLFRRYNPSVVFHAAAHKHVPLMEYCPYEAVLNNIFGTYNVMEAAKNCGCEKFVLISSDKAVNPTNIMGATKRYCENMLHAFSLEPDNKTVFVSVRFGNVLGSHGSVIPLFQMQIAQGGPVTITDKRMTRYFMTIPEASGLVLRAGAMAKSSETYILDMGKPVKILELADNLIRLSGFTPYEEIDIVESGLRPGEKLYEELLVNDKNHTATSDSKIFIERNETNVGLTEINRQLALLKKSVDETDNGETMRLMRVFVPNFRTPDEVNSTLYSVKPKLDEDEASDCEIVGV